MAVLERNELGAIEQARLNWDYIQTGNIATTGGVVEAPVEGASWAAIDTRGVSSLTWIVEAQRSAGNWVQIPIYPHMLLGAPVSQQVSTTSGVWFARVAGFSSVRVRCTAYTSGAMITTLATTMSTYPPTGVQPPEPIPLLVRPALVAANTAVTVTIPAPGVGLYQIIHQIRVWGHNNSAAAVAPTATFAITTTNLNAIAWNNINDYPAWTKKELIYMDIENGLRAQAANAACTIVIPALGAGVVTEALVLYKNGY